MMGAFLLDTHVWFWLVTGERTELSSALVRRLERHAKQRPLLVSVISAWEIALLEAKGRIGFAVPVRQWMEHALDRPGFSLVGLSVAIAVESCHLPGEFHADPSDRFLVATARAERATLVTRDEKIIRYGKAGYVHVLQV
jgi:PIN domain nuclease of toxin-antitoxin system